MAGIAVSRRVFVWAPAPARLTPVISAPGAQIWQRAAALRYRVGIGIGPAADWHRLVSSNRGRLREEAGSGILVEVAGAA
jgi:hypothetical protein